jgi:S1-C subfamily serine protease
VLALSLPVLALTDVLGGGGDRSRSDELASAVERATPSTVIVTSRGPRSGGQGSGWVLDATAGLVATNFHVVNGGDTFRIGTADGMSRDAKLFAAAPCDDLALLRVGDRSGLRTMPLGAQAAVEEGEQVAALGFPVDASPGDDLTSTVGVVSVARDDQVSLGRDAPPLPNAIGTDALITPGSSGGPLIDSQGRLVGQSTGGLAGNLQGRPVQGQGYAIGVDRVKEVAAVLRQGRSQGWTGMSLVVLSRRELARNRLPQGLAVTAAVPGSPAAAAGIGRRPLVLTEIDGVRLRPSMASYCRVAGQASRGDSAVFSLVGGPGGPARDVELDFK